MLNFIKSKMLIFVIILMIAMKTAYQEEELVDVLEAVETTDVMDLVVFNDDFNTFDHVIDTLIRVCKHSKEQAEQCTLLIHYKGKCAVKNGTFDFLRPMREAICEAGIDARIV
jgi:ATP-dependent Clp protease adaptor protein ClpS